MRLSRLLKFLPATFVAGALFGIVATTAVAAIRGSAIFSDVPSGHYADEAIADAFNAGVITGYDATHFGPNDPVTRGQLSLIFSRLGLIEKSSGGVSSSRSSRASSSVSSASSVSSGAAHSDQEAHHQAATKNLQPKFKQPTCERSSGSALA